MRVPLLAIGLVAALAGLAMGNGDEWPPPMVGAAADPGGPPAYDATPYGGLGTWVDVFDFSPRFAPGGEPDVTPDDVDAMADAGVTTLFLQAGRDDERIPGGIVDPPLVAEFLLRAHARGVRVVAWYLPEHYDTDDMLRLEGLRDFRAGGHAFDGLAVDIEWTKGVPDPAERNRRLVDFSHQLRGEMGDATLGAIVLPTVLLEVVNTEFWPDFPWRELAGVYDVWLPMTYWTDRTWASGYRDAGRYVDESIRRMLANLGRPVALHPIGGIGDRATVDDYRGFGRIAREHAATGLSVYDYDTTPPHHWAVLREAAP